MQKQDEPFSVELKLDNDSVFYSILLDAIDESFSTLGEQAKTSIYSYLESSMGIRKAEIPFRIDDFQTALERLFGIGARYVEILFIKNMHEKIKVKYPNENPRCLVPDLTFQQYVRMASIAYENSN